MNTAQHYRERAEECRAIAEHHKHEEVREQWHNMAIVYDRMAIQVAWMEDYHTRAERYPQ